MASALALVACCFLLSVHARAATQQVVCADGNGKYEVQMDTGVTVRVSAALHHGFAGRACSATLLWSHDQLVAVPSTAQIDIDVLGADLGFGMPVVAFQVREADDAWQASYVIYSLTRNPRLLATITGGDLYRASDADFNKRVAIWTTNAAAVNGFDGLTYADFDATPTIVLRYEKDRLTDVSAEYQTHYDKQIAQVRAQLDSKSLSGFQQSDGKLALGSVPGAELVRLRKTKVKVLEITWDYLYSGREDQAWAELDSAWPASDVARVKAAILAARAKGIDAQVAAIAPKTSSGFLRKHPYIYETVKTTTSRGDGDESMFPGMPPVSANSGQDDAPAQTEVTTLPRYILMWGPPPSGAEQSVANTQQHMVFILDETGKVRSAKMNGSPDDPALLDAAKDWKFIPAFRNGKPVACIYRMNVSPFL
ncbi:MAG: hypothetical protein WA414_20550 [Acidobacteriaceae bacterium]